MPQIQDFKELLKKRMKGYYTKNFSFEDDLF